MSSLQPFTDPDRSPSSRQVLLAEIALLLRELHPDERHPPVPRLDSRLDRDLGLDSLTRMELLARLEQRFRIEIPESAGFAAATPSDLLKALHGARPRGTIGASAVLALVRGEHMELPVAASTMTEVLAWHAERHPERVHVRFSGGTADGVELTYRTLQGAARRMAAGLQSHGIRPAEPVGLMLPTHPDFLCAFFGIMLAGGVPVPLYPPLRPHELTEYWHRQAGILRNCGARRLVVDDALYARRRLIRALTGGVEHLLTASALANGSAAFEPVAAQEDDLALLQYTSGSTADPKGVMVSHRNMLANLRVMGGCIGVDASDAFVSWLPLYHDMGLIGAWLGCLYFGAPLVLMPPQSFLLRPERWLWAIHQHRATLSAAPNFAYELCVHRIDDEALEGLDLSSLRLAFCGAEPVFAQTLERFAIRFARHGFRADALYPVYGLAENTLGLTFPPPGRGVHVLHVERDRFLRSGHVQVRFPGEPMTLPFVSCGTVLPGHELRIADSDEHELPGDRQGRVQFRGPSACAGYYHNPDATRAFKRGAWLDSGDLGFLHEGELYLTGRVKDLIIRAGRHLHPQGVEQAVGDLPGVRRGRVAAFGAATPSAGTERLIVVAETRLGDDSARQALRLRIQELVADLAGEPADEIVLAAPGTILKTSSGKLRRAACRAAYERGRLGSRSFWPMLAVLGRSALVAARVRAGRLGTLAFSGYAWLVLGLLAPPAVLAVALLPTVAARWRVVRALLAVARRATGIPLTLATSATLPPSPCIFVANHASYIDALVLVLALPRPVTFVAKKELARWPLARMLLRFGAVFVARFDPARCTAVVEEASRSGRDFLFFPEGTFNRMPGLLRFRLGAFAAASRAGLPLVPIALRGTRTVLHAGDWLVHHAPLSVTFGPTLLPNPAVEHWPETLRLADVARKFLLAHCGEPDSGSPEAGP